MSLTTLTMHLAMRIVFHQILTVSLMTQKKAQTMVQRQVHINARGEGILEYPDVGAEDANQDATRIPQGCRKNTTGMLLGCR